MPHVRLALPLLAAVLGASGTPATSASTADAGVGPAVTVVFVQPERFTDVGDREVASPNVRAAFLRALERHLQRSTAPRLDPGQTLVVTITDVDMAGAFEPWRRTGSDVRIVRDIYPPRITLSFRLADAAGDTVRAGELRLVGVDFLARPTMPSTDPLMYEKALLDDWLSEELGSLRAADR